MNGLEQALLQCHQRTQSLEVFCRRFRQDSGVEANVWSAWEREAGQLWDMGIDWVCTGQDDYPNRLRAMKMNHAWPILFVKGRMELLRQLAIGIVGTRRPSAAAAQSVIELSKHLVRQNRVIVSGNAQGIDAAAHRGALEGSGATIHVLPCDLVGHFDKSSNTKSADTSSSLWLSPYLPGQPTHRGMFIRRNELIAGLCDALIIGEMGVKSGTIHAVRAAFRNRMPVFVMCDHRGRPRGDGGQGLVAMGATPLIPCEDMAQTVIQSAHEYRKVIEMKLKAGEHCTTGPSPQLFPT